MKVSAEQFIKFILNSFVMAFMYVYFSLHLHSRIVSSAGLERCLDRAEAAGSNPAQFTATFQNTAL